MELDEARLKPKRTLSCLYCKGPHTYDRCKHPDVLAFSEYLVNLFKELYQMKASFENKQEAAYNLLSEYSTNLLITASRNKSDWCRYKNTYANKQIIASKKDIINDLTSCMFQYIKAKIPELEEGTVNLTYTDRFKNTIANVNIFSKRTEPSAPPIEQINMKNIEYNDIQGPSAPPMETGGKPKKTLKRRKNKKHLTLKSKRH